MELHNLTDDQELIVQIVWGEHVIEFSSHLVERLDNGKGIYITPYMHNGHALELNISRKSGIICNIFADEISTGKRVSWRNIELTSIKERGMVKYHISTFQFNKSSQADDRRAEERIRVNIYGTIADSEGRMVQIKIHDISDGGIGIYVPNNYHTSSDQITVLFADYANGEDFHIKISCSVVRTVSKPGAMFYGCKIMKNSRDYLLYGCLKRTALNLEKQDVYRVDK